MRDDQTNIDGLSAAANIIAVMQMIGATRFLRTHLQLTFQGYHFRQLITT